MKFRYVFILIFIVLLLATACTGKRLPPAAPPIEDSRLYDYADSFWPALALLETGENPLWFELGSGGPLHIESPESASLAPYVPWPHARFVVGILPWDGFLVMAINREGFLVLGPAAEPPAKTSNSANMAKVVLYQASADGFWDAYTAESFFIWKDNPAILLYRNDFFTEPFAPSPQPQVFTLDKSSTAPMGARIPALELFPPGESWETELLRRGPDGLWYFRMKEKGMVQNETAYFCARDLEETSERISIDTWRNSGSPEKLENIPPVMSGILDSAVKFGLAGTGQELILRLISTGFDGTRLMGSSAATAAINDENPAFFYAYCRDKPEPLALAVLPDGQGFYFREPGRGRSSVPIVRSIALPALPEEFVYTGVALLGDVVLASWEEQQEAGIGAAGFMVMKVSLQ